MVFNWKVRVNKRFQEIIALALYWTWFIYLLKSFPSWWELILVALISNFTCGILHLQIVISHFAMATHEDRRYDPYNRAHWLQLQLDTTLNVDCPKWLDWFHGGLQF